MIGYLIFVVRSPSFKINNYKSYIHSYKAKLKIAPTMIERYEYMFDNLPGAWYNWIKLRQQSFVHNIKL